MGHLGIIVAAGGNPLSLVLDNFKFVQMGAGCLCEQDWRGVVQDSVHDDLIDRLQSFGRRTSAQPSLSFHDVKGR